MKQKLVYILKHNMAIQAGYRICMSFAFKILGIFVPVDDNLVLILSFMGSKYNDSPKVIYEYMQEHPRYKKYNCVWAFEHPEQYPELNTVKIDTLAYFRLALKAKYWVTNTNIERGLRFKKKNQVYLNTWHGIALKNIGNDCPGRKDYNFDTLDYLCVSGEHDERVFKSAFNAQASSYVRCGMPRNDQLWKATSEDRIAMRKKLNIPDGKKVIMYAPTWRDSVDSGKTYLIKPPIDFAKWEKVFGEKYIILFRAHHLTTKVLNVQFNEFIRDVSDYPEVNELMIASDMMITDYSAIAFDYSILCRPLFCYAYDYETYLAERGTYFDIDECYPEKACRTEGELLDSIINVNVVEAGERTKKFRNVFVKHGEKATEQCVELLFGGMKSESLRTV